ncbi:hypothetical protein [Ferruginibacter sp. SUN106]|uniref:hypothetical protein n=1 Tax=Ferruginibacter sp. SUN106 TaxID=2978348 RepID=UPI003D36AA17
MKKLAAILLLGVFIFNLFGYRLFVSFMVNNANQSLEAAIDKNNYNEDQLISIKKAINLPYYNNTKDFSRAYGEVEVNGVLYQYVKSRIYNDSLEMLCIPNVSKQQMLESKDNFARSTFDLQKDTNKKAPGSGKLISFVKLLSEYVKHSDWNVTSSNSTTISLQNTSYYNANSGSLHKATIEQPPDTFNS